LLKATSIEEIKMTILSRVELLERILIGEKLINKGKKEDLTLIEKCLKAVRSSARAKKLEEDPFTKYFQKARFSGDSLLDRRQKIKEIGESLLKKGWNETKSSSKVNKKLPVLIDDIDYEKCVRGANYDLRLGEDVYVTTERIPRKLTRMGADGSIAIEPGEFGMLMTHEYICIPQDLMGFISVRLTYKQRGLVNISGFHVDPGFYGRLMFAVYNAGPSDVTLRYKERVFMIMFNKLTTPVPKVPPSRWQGMEKIPLEAISGLRGTSISVRNLDERIKKLEIIFPVLITILVGLIGIVLTWVITKWWP